MSNSMAILKISVFIFAMISVSQCSSGDGYLQNKVAGKSSQISSRIFGGTLATLGLVPWQACLTIYGPPELGTWYCGASLVHQQWILTSAKCLDNAVKVTVRLGSLTCTSGGTSVDSTAFFPHQSYKYGGVKEADIALIKLPSLVTLTTNIKVIEILPKTMTGGTALRTFRISGYGVFNSNGTTDYKLRYASVTEITDQSCFSTFGVFLPFIMCANGGSAKESICYGDFGGPLVLLGTTNYLVGISSFTGPRCDIATSQAYVEVTPFYDWIRQTTGL